MSNVDIGFVFDTNSTEAAQSRRKTLRVLERRRDLVLSFHDNFPGFGYIRRKRKFGFDWVFASLNDLQPKNIESCPL